MLNQKAPGQMGIWNQHAEGGMEPKAPEVGNKLNQHIDRGSSLYRRTCLSSHEDVPPRGRGARSRSAALIRQL